MNGQWIGNYSGTNTGLVVLELDDHGDHWAGDVYALNANTALPAMLGYVSRVPKDQVTFTVRVPLGPLDRDSGRVMDAKTLVERFPDVRSPEYAEVKWTIVPGVIHVEWTTNVGTNGTAELRRSGADEPSELEPRSDITTWKEFKEFVARQEPYRLIYRGQEKSDWRLRTSFHRTRRASLQRFMTEDVNVLNQHLTGLTTHRFNLADSFEYAAF